MSEAADILEQLAAAASTAAVVPGPMGIAAKVASLAFGAAAVFARAGQDPVIEIERILDPHLEAARGRFRDTIDREFPAKPDAIAGGTPTDRAPSSGAAPPPDTLSDSDVYDD